MRFDAPSSTNRRPGSPRTTATPRLLRARRAQRRGGRPGSHPHHGPLLDANGVYPVFFIWKTGFLESLEDVVGDSVKGILPAGAWRDVIESIKDAAQEAKDRAIEATCQRVLVRAVW